MKSIRVLLGILACVVLLPVAQGASTPRPLADVSIPLPDGKTVRLSQYRGKVMVVAVISTTCEHCVKAVEVLSRVQKELGSRGVQVVAAAVDDKADKLVGAFNQKNKPAFPVGSLDQETTMKLADFKRDDHPFVPIYIFVDKQGTVRFQYAGNHDFFKDEENNVRLLVESLLKK